MNTTHRQPATRGTRVLLTVMLAAALVVSAGCWPRQLVIWSPDGNRAVVMDANETSLCDAEGKLARLDLGAVQGAAWLADSKSVLLAVRESATTWEALAEGLDDEEKQVAISLAKDFEKAVKALPGDKEASDEQAEAIVKQVFSDYKIRYAPAAFMYLKDRGPGVIAKRLGKRWREGAEDMSVDYTALALYDLDGMALKPGKTILTTLRGVLALRLAPNDKTAAYVTSSDEIESGYTLWLAPVSAGARPTELADGVALYPDFSADSRYVAYIQSTSKEKKRSLSLGTLSRRRVADRKGKLLTEPRKAEDLAGMLFAESLGVRCMRDGRILFAAAAVKLPATPADMPEQASLYAFDPARSTTLARVLPRQAEADLPKQMLFELSGNQEMVSVTGSDGKVCVVTLADGKVRCVQKQGGNLRMLPSWRKANELCMFVPPAEDKPEGRPEVGLWSEGTTRIISKDWPDEVIKNLNFMGRDKAETKPEAPATEPGD